MINIIYNNEEFFETKYNGYYVSKSGKIVSTRRNKNGRYLIPKEDKDGYLEVLLSVNNKKYYKRLHMLILETFVEIPKDMINPTVDHIDGNRKNNKLENLRWLTRGNNARLGRSGKKPKLAKHIILNLENKEYEFFSALDMCKKLGVSIGTYNLMKKNKKLGCRNKYKVIKFLETPETIEIELEYNS